MDEQKAPMANKGDVETNKWMGVISYIGPLALVPLLAAKKSPFAQYHAKQGMVLFVGLVLIRIAAGFLSWTIQDLVELITSIAYAVLAILGIMSAWKGEMKELPIIGSIAKSLKM